MRKERVEELIGIHRDGLLKDTVPFWLRHTIDRECGGFLNYLDADGTVLCTDKPVWVLGRFTWLMSVLYNEVEKKQEWLETAKHGMDFIEKHCFDSDGRMFFEVARDGRPLRKRRYVFTETFGIIALLQYGLATGDEGYVAKARKLFELVMRYHRTEGLLEPKEYPQTRKTKGHAMPMILLCTAQQMRLAGEDGLWEQTIDECLREVFEDFMHPELKALLETVGPKGEFLDYPAGRCVNPGHAIESSWFIMEAYRRGGDKKLLEKGCEILDWSLELGWDEEFGGILYFVDVKGHPALQYEHDMKLWWPHNEAMYACLLAHHLTGQEKYEQWYEKLHEYAYSHFPDKKNGEWFKYLHRDGTVSSTVKGNGWAGPFHVPRMQLYCWKLLEEMRG